MKYFQPIFSKSCVVVILGPLSIEMKDNTEFLGDVRLKAGSKRTLISLIELSSFKILIIFVSHRGTHKLWIARVQTGRLEDSSSIRNW